MFSNAQLETISLDLLQRIHINPNTGCWEWLGARIGDQRNYGQMWLSGFKSPLRVHRVSAEVFLDYDLDKDLKVLHKCDNPICCNPDHLFIGTNLDNTQDMLEKGRHHELKKTHCPRGHEYTPENTYIQISYTGNKKRSCQICRNARNITGKSLN